MRKVIALLALGLLAASSASAASFWTESFAYSNGNLAITPNVSGGLWVNHSTGATYTDIQVTGGEAVLIGANGADDSRNFTARTATAITYACFKMKINAGTESTGNSYIAHFKDSTTGFVSQVFIFPLGASTYNIAISSTSTAPTGTAIWSTPLYRGTYYTIAIRYNAATGVSTLWVDPTLGESSPSINSVSTKTGTLVSGFALRQAIGVGSTFDDISVGDTFCPEPVVPTSSESWSSVKSQYR
jgi:hypothetical protein